MFKFRCVVGAVAVFAALNFGRAADDAFDLRGPAPQKGAQYATVGKLTVKAADATMTRGKDVVKFKLTLTATLEETVTLVAVADRSVTQSAVRVDKDRVETAGLAKGAAFTETSVLEKETVVSARDGTKWTHALASGKPTEAQLKELAERGGIESDDGLYPAEQVKAGHAWTADAGAFSRLLGHSLSGMKGKLSQKFVRVEMLNGEPVAVIESTGKVSGKMKGNGDPAPDADIELTLTTWKSLKTGLAVREAFAGSVHVRGDTKDGDAVTTIEIKGPISGESTTTLVDKK